MAPPAVWDIFSDFNNDTAQDDNSFPEPSEVAKPVEVARKSQEEIPNSFSGLMVGKSVYATFNRAEAAVFLEKLREERAILKPAAITNALALEEDVAKSAACCNVSFRAVSSTSRPKFTSNLPFSASIEETVADAHRLQIDEAKFASRLKKAEAQFKRQCDKHESLRRKKRHGWGWGLSPKTSLKLLLSALLAASSIVVTSASLTPSSSGLPSLPPPSRLGIGTRGGSRSTAPMMDTHHVPNLETLQKDAANAMASRQAAEGEEQQCSEILTDILIAAKRYITPGLPTVVKESRKQELDCLLEELRIEDFGFSESVGFCAGHGCVRCYNLYRDETMDLSLFRLAPGTKIPMHAHPSMEISCRVLFGTARYESCDVTDEVIMRDGKKLRRMINHADCEGKGPHTHVVKPDEGNLHEITAVSDNGMAFFDIITPSYSCKLPFYVKTEDGLLEEVECSHFGNCFQKKMVDYPGLPLDMKKFKAASGKLTASEMELVANQKRSPRPHQGG